MYKASDIKLLFNLNKINIDVKKRLKKSGIYRLYIINPNTNQQLSYVGISSNIYKRLLQHKKWIDALYLNKKICLSKNNYVFFKNHIINYILENTITAKHSCYQKIWMKMIEFDLNLESVNFEILEIIDDYKIKNKGSIMSEIEKKEEYYIKIFKSDIVGFNGIFAFEYKVAHYKTQSSYMLHDLKTKLLKKRIENIQWINKALNKDLKMNEWVYWQAKDLLSYETKLKYSEIDWDIYNKYCRKIIKKITITHSKHDFKNFDWITIIALRLRWNKRLVKFCLKMIFLVLIVLIIFNIFS